MFEVNLKYIAVMAGLLASATCTAQDKAQTRDQAQAMAAVLRKAGEPKDRCSLGARLVDGAIVTSVSDGAPLQPGDRLLAINKIDVSGKTADYVLGILRGVGPDSVIEVSLERNSVLMNAALVCQNSRPVIQQYWQVLMRQHAGISTSALVNFVDGMIWERSVQG